MLRVAGLRDHGTTHAPPLLVFQTTRVGPALPIRRLIITGPRPRSVGIATCRCRPACTVPAPRQRGWMCGWGQARALLPGTERQDASARQTRPAADGLNDYPPGRRRLIADLVPRLGEHVRCCRRLLDHISCISVTARASSAWPKSTVRCAWMPPPASVGVWQSPPTITLILRRAWNRTRRSQPAIASVGAYLHGPEALLHAGPLQRIPA